MRTKKLFAIMALSLTGLLPNKSFASDPGIQFIVNAGNPADSLDASQIIDFFLKRARQWPSGDSVRFVDRREGSPERTAFLSSFLQKTPRELELYWIGQKLYTGAAAPLQAPTDMMTAQLVASFKGAIGYVSSSFKGAKGVKVIPVKTSGE